MAAFRRFSLRGLSLVFLLVMMGAERSGSDNVTTSFPPHTSSHLTLVPSSIPSSPSLSPLSTSFRASLSPSYSDIRMSTPDSPSVEPTVLTTDVIMSLVQTMSQDSALISWEATSILMTPSLASSHYATSSSKFSPSTSLSSSSSTTYSLSPSSTAPYSTSLISLPPLTLQMSSTLSATSLTATIPTTPSIALNSSTISYNSLSPTPSVNATLPYSQLIPTQSLRPTTIVTPTPTPTMVASSTLTPILTVEPNELSLLEWFGIAVGCAAVFFILFLVYHCHQVRQQNILRQKKEMKKEILHVDLSQGPHGDRVSSWRTSIALDAMTTHIELPREDTGMDMQWMDNLGFEEVYLGDEPKTGNNNALLPQTNL